MANITITIPDTLIPDVRSAVGRLYGNAVSGLTDKEKIAYHLRQSLTPQVKAIRRAGDATLTAARATRESNDDARSSAQATDNDAVSTAEAAADSASETALGGIA